MKSGVLKNQPVEHVHNGIQKHSFWLLRILASLPNSVLKSHPADVHVYKDIQNVAFDYLGDCQICDLDSVKSNVLKSHSVDEHVLN